MKTKFKYILILLFLAYCELYFVAQTPTLDSLKLVLKNAKHDTTKCNILNALIEAESNDTIWIKYNDELKSISEKNLNIYSSNNPLFKTYIKYSALVYNNMGYLAEIKGNIPKAIVYYIKSLEINEKTENKIGIGYTLNNIGYLYFNQGETDKAKEYTLKSLQISKVTGNKKGVADALNTLGLICLDTKEVAKGLECFINSLKIREEINDKSGIAVSLNNIANSYNNEHKYALALEYSNKSLKINEEIGDKRAIAYLLNNIAALYLNQKNYNKALKYSVNSMKLSKELGYPSNIKNAAIILTKIYKGKNDYKNALINYELFIQMRDSISNQETKKASIKSQLKYEYEKKVAADSVLVAEEKKLTTVKFKHEQNQRYFLYGGLGLTVLFGLFMFNRFRVTQKQKAVIEQQKKIVEMQKHIVEEKQKEIIDSIRYAKRIQQSLLPTEKFIERILTNK